MSRIAFVLIFFIFNGFILLGQQQKNPLCYLNSEKIDLKKVYINPSSIEAINIKKETSDGEIYITSKSKIEFLTLAFILEKYAQIKNTEDKVLVRIDGKLISDIADIKVDNSFFVYVDTEHLSNTTYIDDRYRDLVIVNISLESKDRKTQIRLRGKDNPDSILYPKREIEE